MRLSNRIKELKQQRAIRSASDLVSDVSLKDKIARCHQRHSDKQSIQKISDSQLAEELGAVVLDKGVLLREVQYSIDYRHGRYTFQELFNYSLKLKTGRYLFMDTETTGLSGGSGTRVFQLGLGFIDVEKRSFILRQYLLSSVSGEKAMLKNVSEFIRDDDILLSYNGKSFDAPLLNARYRLAGLVDPFEKLRHLDLLHPIRRYFRRTWPNCRLNSVERYLLGFRRVDDLPGSEAPQVWFEWLRFGIAQRLKDVLKHNEFDVLSMGVIFPMIEDIENRPHLYQADILAVAKHHLRCDDPLRAMHLLREHIDVLCDQGLSELAGLLRRFKYWDEAIEIWKRLAMGGDLVSIENLAKYYEHQARDYPAAIEATKCLLSKDFANPLHRHRHKRLENRQLHAKD